MLTAMYYNSIQEINGAIDMDNKRAQWRKTMERLYAEKNGSPIKTNTVGCDIPSLEYNPYEQIELNNKRRHWLEVLENLEEEKNNK